VRFSIKAKQVAGVTSIVIAVVVVLSVLHLSSLARVRLEESQARGDLLANAIYHRARQVVAGQQDPYAAIRDDSGLRAILESSIYSKNVTYAAVMDAGGVVVAHTDPGREGERLTPRGDLRALLARDALGQLRAIYGEEGRTYEVNQRLRMGEADFGSIRIGVSTLLVRQDLHTTLRTPVITALVLLVVVPFLAMLLTTRMLRPIHVIRTGLAQLRKGEPGVTLDLPKEDEFAELSSSFNALSAQVQADRTKTAQLESVVENLEDGVAVFNGEGELLQANEAMRTLLPADPIGKPIDDLFPRTHPLVTLVQETLATRDAKGWVPILFGSDHDGDGEGGERLVMTEIMEDRHRALVGTMVSVRNKAALDQVQSMIKYSQKQVQLGERLAGVGHEVRTPLNAMAIHVELLRGQLARASGAPARSAEGVGTAVEGSGGGVTTAIAETSRDGSADPGDLDHVGIIAHEIRRLDDLVTGLLRFTRPEDLKLEPLALAELVQEVVRVVQPEADRSHVSIETTIGRELPTVYGDPAMLQTAFLNLALNAIQAMPTGGALRIRAAQTRGRTVSVTFEDTGVGIDPEHLNKIFNLYFTTKERGSGIGLALVYRTVVLHDGTIEVESSPGHTAFTVGLPIVAQSSQVLGL
jgi:signal transduction histidine kinase/HAMP domain-containing protein